MAYKYIKEGKYGRYGPSIEEAANDPDYNDGHGKLREEHMILEQSLGDGFEIYKRQRVDEWEMKSGTYYVDGRVVPHEVFEAELLRAVKAEAEKEMPGDSGWADYKLYGYEWDSEGFYEWFDEPREYEIDEVVFSHEPIPHPWLRLEEATSQFIQDYIELPEEEKIKYELMYDARYKRKTLVLN